MNLTTIVFTHQSALCVWEQRKVIKWLQMREQTVQPGTMTLEGVEGAGLGKRSITGACWSLFFEPPTPAGRPN